MIKKVIRGIIGLLAIFSLVGAIYLLIIDKEGFIGIILSLVGGKSYAQGIIASLITSKTFLLIRAFTFSLFAAFSIIYMRWEQIYGAVKFVFANLMQSIALRAKLNFPEFALLLPIPVFFSIYYAVTLPIFVDEAYTYLMFSSRSLLTAITYYPSTNNHLLNSAITSIFVSIPYFSQTFLLRTPTIIINIFTLFTVYSFVKEYAGKKAGMITTAIFSTLFLVTYYSFLARGYEIFIFLFMVTSYSAFKIIAGRNIAWVYFSIASVLSLYNALWFVYPFLILNCVILILSPRQFYNSVRWNLKIGVFTFILYIPLIIVNGLNAIINNVYNKPIRRSEVISRLPHFLIDSYQTISGYNIWCIACIMLISLLVLYFRNRKFFVYGVAFIVILPILLVIHSVIPYARTVLFYAFIMSFIPVAACADKIDRVNKWAVIVLCICIQIIQSYRFNQHIYVFEKETVNTDKVIKEANKHSNICVGSFLFGVYYDYYFKSHHLPFPRFTLLNEKNINSDTLINKYDFIIIDSAYDRTKITPLSMDLTPYHVYQTTQMR